MQSPMVRGAEHDEVVFFVRATVGAGVDVVDVDERRIATVGNRATSMVAAHDFAAKCWGNRLGRARWFTHVGLAVCIGSEQPANERVDAYSRTRRRDAEKSRQENSTVRTGYIGD